MPIRRRIHRPDAVWVGLLATAIVTPHASFLALREAPKATLANLARLEDDFATYDSWGFRDSVSVETGAVSGGHLRRPGTRRRSDR